MEAEQGLLLCLPSPAATQESSVSLFLPATWILSSVLSLRPHHSSLQLCHALQSLSLALCWEAGGRGGTP